MKSIGEKIDTLERFSDEEVRVRLISPSGRIAVLPVDTIYEEETNQGKVFYMSEQGYRLKPSQFEGVSMIATKNGISPVLSFQLNQYGNINN